MKKILIAILFLFIVAGIGAYVLNYDENGYPYGTFNVNVVSGGGVSGTRLLDSTSANALYTPLLGGNYYLGVSSLLNDGTGNAIGSTQVHPTGRGLFVNSTWYSTSGNVCTYESWSGGTRYAPYTMAGLWGWLSDGDTLREIESIPFDTTPTAKAYSLTSGLVTLPYIWNGSTYVIPTSKNLGSSDVPLTALVDGLGNTIGGANSPVYTTLADSESRTINVFLTGYGSQMAMGVSSTVVDISRNHSMAILPYSDTEGFAVITDKEEYVQKVIGKKFRMFIEDTDLDTAEELFITISVPNGTTIGARGLIQATGFGKAYLYEGVAYSGGTAINILNANRTSTVTSGVTAYYGSATTTATTMIDQFAFTSGDGFSRCSYTVLGAGDYLLRIVTSADNNNVLFKMEWLEQN